MRRIWVEREQIGAEEVTLEGESYHHAVRVIRLQLEEKFEVVCGEDTIWQVQLAQVGKKAATARIIGQRTLPEIPRPHLCLAVALTKWSTLETIVEKAVEMGVNAVQPLFTEFSFTRSLKDYPRQKVERLQKIIRAATEQCGRGTLMRLNEPLTLQAFVDHVNRAEGELGLFAYEGEATLDIETALRDLPLEKCRSVWALVGSEGGFSAREVQFLSTKNWPPVTMGDQILRADTACLTLLSVIKYQAGLMRRN